MQKTILLTGATGYVGSHLISKLARQKNVDQIFCLTRHNDHDSFWSTIMSNKNRYNIDVHVPDIKAKTELISIDLVQNHDSILSTLAKYKKTVNVVHHLAGDLTFEDPLEHFESWANATKKLIQYCMDSKYPKHFYTTGSYGHYLLDSLDSLQDDEDAYWRNGYLQHKKWLHYYMLEKMDHGLKGTLFEPSFVFDTLDPGQYYAFWRIVRMFAALGYAFEYPMLCTPTDMLVDNYILAQDYPDESPKFMCPIIPQKLYVHKAMQKLLPDLKVVDYEHFRQIIKQVLPKKAKYFGPNLQRGSELTKVNQSYHPLYSNPKYTSMDTADYLSSCKSLVDAVAQGISDKQAYMDMKKKAAPGFISQQN